MKLIVKVRIYHIQCINKHLEKKYVDLKTGFLRIFSKNKKKNARKGKISNLVRTTYFWENIDYLLGTLIDIKR